MIGHRAPIRVWEGSSPPTRLLRPRLRARTAAPRDSRRWRQISRGRWSLRGVAVPKPGEQSTRATPAIRPAGSPFTVPFAVPIAFAYASRASWIRPSQAAAPPAFDPAGRPSIRATRVWPRARGSRPERAAADDGAGGRPQGDTCRPPHYPRTCVSVVSRGGSGHSCLTASRRPRSAATGGRQRGER